MSKLLWLRCEEKPGEQRTPLLPRQTQELIKAGIEVVVEEDPGKIFTSDEYLSFGAKIVPSQSWKTAPKQAVILGLKELEEDNFSLEHTHIHFAHCFKKQKGSSEFLKRFKNDGKLYDLEFLKLENGKRIAAFGYWAGFIGAAIAFEAYNKLQETGSLKTFQCRPYPSREEYIEHLKKLCKLRPSAFIMGSLGRCGKGAKDFLSSFDINITGWDKDETSKKDGPYPEILEHEIFLNCVFLNKPTPAFLTKEMLKKSGKLSIISDVSCDPGSPHNPLPIYSKVTNLEEPFTKITDQVHLQAIDHLPTLLPRESSEEFCQDFFPHLKNFLLDTDPDAVWKSALDLFNTAR